MKNFVQAGSQLTLTAPAAVAGGAIVKVGSIIGVACGSALLGEDVDVATFGVFELPKASTDDIAVGDVVYHRASDGLVTKTASGNTRLGVAVTVAPNPSGTVNVRLNGTF